MEFRTIVNIPRAQFTIEPCQKMLFVGSCFADSIGRKAQEEMFRATVNPYGVMYNPASILHTLERLKEEDVGKLRADIVILTLGTNHVYWEKETGQIVDNCQKRPQNLFKEEQLTINQCADYLRRSVLLLRAECSDVKVIVTVSPIRYRKYGYHESQLSKATLLLAIDTVVDEQVHYFPAYEIVQDELRDYRFYRPDMLHPSEQAIDYIWQRFADTFFSDRTNQFLLEWQPVREALNHRPFDPDSDDYKSFIQKTLDKVSQLAERYEGFEINAIS